MFRDWLKCMENSFSRETNLYKGYLCIKKRVGYGRAMKTGIDHSIIDIMEIIDADNTYEACAIDRKYSEFFYWENPK